VVNHNVFVCFMIAEMARGKPAVVPAGAVEHGQPAPSRDGFVFAPHLARIFVGADDDLVDVWNRGRDDPLVHAWDLAKAVGQPPVLDPTLAQRALDHLTAFGKHQELRQPISLAAPIVTAAQDPVSRLIACTGRQP
jgi:hypothetical protein